MDSVMKHQEDIKAVQKLETSDPFLRKDEMRTNFLLKWNVCGWLKASLSASKQWFYVTKINEVYMGWNSILEILFFVMKKIPGWKNKCMSFPEVSTLKAQQREPRLG